MRREPSLTLEGALRILGKQDHKVLNRLGALLGGTILLAGVASAISAIGPLALTVTAIAPIWGWIDQKNEAITLLKKLVDGAKSRFGESGSLEKRELITAAHSAIVGAALFETLRESIGEVKSDRINFSDSEKLQLAIGVDADLQSDLVRQLYEVEIPIPGPTIGFEENLPRVMKWMEDGVHRISRFADGLDLPANVHLQPSEIVDAAVARYRTYYLELAMQAPEFEIWTFINEHGATRGEARVHNEKINAIIEQQGVSLMRMHAILESLAIRDTPGGQARTVIERTNIGRMTEPVIRREVGQQLEHLAVPDVGQAFVAPTFRVVKHGRGSHPADEDWWADQVLQEDLDLWLSGYALHIDSCRLPLLLLGHPGAGKSMLMKVLAARLPAVNFSVTVVALRAVGANAPILDQVQQGLDVATNRRVQWHNLASESDGVTRVLIFDGLDELLQASNVDRSGYLQEVMEFQRVEAEQGRPLIAIVTSRTVVVDRIDIPSDAVILKLEAFDEKRIETWLRVWNSTNASGIRSGKVGELSAQAARSQFELARQPLLLLMLALYAADTDALPLDAGASTAALYRRIFEVFSRREVLKGSRGIPDHTTEPAVEAHVNRLSIAALAMFNRASQSVSDQQLTADLIAFGLEDAERDQPGRRLLGEFFFMHTAEARLLTELDDSGAIDSDTGERRSYEFLHATFGEYLVAFTVFEELRDVAEASLAGRKHREPDVDRLFQLLSFQPLVVRRSILLFARDLASELEAEEFARVLLLLRSLMSRAKIGGFAGRFDRYRPVRSDWVRRLACYTNNLVVLGLALSGEEGMSLHSILGVEHRAAEREWFSLVNLWRSGLGSDGYQASLNDLSLEGDRLVLASRDVGSEMAGVRTRYMHARLEGDFEAMARERYGLALHNNMHFDDLEDPETGVLSVIYSHLIGYSGSLPLDVPGSVAPQRVVERWKSLFRETPPQVREKIVVSIERLLLSRQADTQLVALHLSALIALEALQHVSSTVVWVNVCRFPELLSLFAELRDPAFYDEPDLALFIAQCVSQAKDDDEIEPSDEFVIREPSHWEELLDALRRRMEAANVSPVRVDPDLRDMVERVVLHLRDDQWTDEIRALRSKRAFSDLRERRSTDLTRTPEL